MKSKVNYSVFSLILICLFFVGCLRPSGRPLSELLNITTEVKSYEVRPGDILNIDVYGEPTLSGERIVREDGQLSMKLVGDVHIQGLKLDGVKAKLEKELARFIPGATVSISLSKQAAIRYFLSGKFVRPGDYRSDTKLTLIQAVATGGGFQPFADDSAVVLIRRTAEGDLRYVLDYSNVERGKEPNPELKDGDTIIVSQ